MKTKSIIVLIAVIIFAFGALAWQFADSGVSSETLDAQAIVYMGEACGCCEVYERYLSRQGVETEAKKVSQQELLILKEEYDVAPELQSCHTTVIDGYVVEGHIPSEVIAKLLREQPDIQGIALPGMPSGTPGMPGPKTGDWEIRAIENDGKISEFLTL